MGEIANFVRRGAAKITPKIMRGIFRQLPMLKLEFADIDDPNHPHLVEQLEFLANVVEDFVEGVAEDLPYVAASSAAFALVYAHQEFDLIPDSVPEIGLADDSAIVRAVLIEHQRALTEYAVAHGLNWDLVTDLP